MLNKQGDAVNEQFDRPSTIGQGMMMVETLHANDREGGSGERASQALGCATASAASLTPVLRAPRGCSPLWGDISERGEQCRQAEREAGRSRKRREVDQLVHHECFIEMPRRM